MTLLLLLVLLLTGIETIHLLLFILYANFNLYCYERCIQLNDLQIKRARERKKNGLKRSIKDKITERTGAFHQRMTFLQIA